jgi:DNA-binding MarR family transcriptional regulator
MSQGVSDLPRTRKISVGALLQESADVNFGALTESIGFLLRRAQLSALGYLVAALAPLELTPIQFSVLVLIESNPDLAQSKLCSTLGVQKANFVTMLDQLEARGLTLRRVSRLDRRINTLALTPEGARLFKRAVAVHEAHERRLLELLGKSGRDQFWVLLNRLLADPPSPRRVAQTSE